MRGSRRSVIGVLVLFSLGLGSNWIGTVLIVGGSPESDTSKGFTISGGVKFSLYFVSLIGFFPWILMTGISGCCGNRVLEYSSNPLLNLVTGLRIVVIPSFRVKPSLK